MKMNDMELLSFLEAEQDSAFHYTSGQLSKERQQSLRDYLRMPYGNEEEGRAQTIASDVFDQVEGMLPDLLDVFISSDKAVVFEPTSQEDEAGAKQATDACNYVFYRCNNGFLILYAAAKDALLMKTGGVKWWWDERRTVSFSTHEADEMQLAAHLASNPGTTLISQEDIEPDPQMVQQREQVLASIPPEQHGMVPEIPRRIRVKLKKVEKKGKVCIEPIPPDELHVSTRQTSLLLDDCPYVAHVCERTLSDIKQMGYDVDISDLKAAQDEATTQDREMRDQLRGGRWGWWQDDNAADDSMARGWLRDEYVLVDFDGDGIAERRRVVRLGKKILENREVSHVPIAAWTPYILTHKFHGMSVAELVGDIQKISTDIWRGQLDNLQHANNQETVVLTDSQGNPLADLDDLLNRRPGGILRERTQGAIRPYNERWQGIEAMPMIELVQLAKERRTGFSPVVSGLDGNSLEKTATEASKLSNERQKRMKLMARIMAEALVAPMFKGIFKTLLDYQMGPLSFRLKGEYVQIDPQEWRDQYDMMVNVGIGTGDDMQQMQSLTQIAQAQFALMQSPMGRIVSETNVFNAQARLAEKAGFKQPTEFFSDPATLGPPLPLPDPNAAKAQGDMQMLQMKLQAEAQQFQQQMQMDAQKTQQQMQAKLQEIQANLGLQAANDQRDGDRERMKAEVQAMLQQRDQELVQYKADLDAQVKLMIAGMQPAEAVDATP